MIIEIKKEFLKKYKEKLEMYNAITEFSISYGRYINSSKEIGDINKYIKGNDGYFQMVLSCVNDVNEGNRNFKSKIFSYIEKCKEWCGKYEHDVEDIKASLRDKKDLCEKICNEKKNNIDEIITKCKKYYNNNVIKYFSGVDKIKGEFDNGCKKYKEEFSKYYNEEIYKLKEIFLEKINDIHDINNNSSFKKLGDIKIENDDNINYKFEENLNLVNVAYGYYKRQPKEKYKEVLDIGDSSIDKNYNNGGLKVEHNNILEKEEYSDEQSNNNVDSIHVELQNNNDENSTQWNLKGKFNRYKDAVEGEKTKLGEKCNEILGKILKVGIWVKR